MERTTDSDHPVRFLSNPKEISPRPEKIGRLAGYLSALLESGPGQFIDNVVAEMQAAEIGSKTVPLVIVDGNTDRNAYVCSAVTHYVDYGIREIELELPSASFVRWFGPRLLTAVRPFLIRTKLDRAVYVNNWLVSTSLPPEFSPPELLALRDACAVRFPDAAIVFRSVPQHSRLYADLRRIGFLPVFSRQTYYVDPREPSYRQKRSFQLDLRLARTTEYQWREIDRATPVELSRIQDLYRQLYIDKYSEFNPQFNVRFVEAAIAGGWLKFYGLEKENRLDAVCGFFQEAGSMTAPFIGYDRTLPEKLGLYRLISLKLIEEAEKRGLILNQSSGAASFKRHRGARAVIEYSLVYSRHLPFHRRLPWWFIRFITEAAVIPVMRARGL